MLKLISLITFCVIGSQSWGAEVHLEAGEKYRIGRTTVFCDGNAEQEERRWLCSCFWGFANMGSVMVYADTVRKADDLGMQKCQRERARETNHVECYEDAR